MNKKIKKYVGHNDVNICKFLKKFRIKYSIKISWLLTKYYLIYK